MANTGNIIVTEQDINPNSATYNQTRTRTYEDETRCPPGGDFKLRYTDSNGTRRTLYCNGETVLSEWVGVVTGTTGGCVTEIGEQWQYRNSDIRSITFSPSVRVIASGAFNLCENLETVNFVEGLESIGQYAFAGCTKITSLTLPSTLANVANDTVFRGCTGLTTLVVNSSHTFQFPNLNITSLTLNQGVTSISGSAFIGNDFTSVTIPNTVTLIGANAFHSTPLTSIVIPNSVTSIGGMAFRNCTSLTSATLPNGITQIREGTFYGCSSLTNISIPESVTTIGNSAFYGCTSFGSVTIPSSVTSIGKQAFKGCTSMTTLDYNAVNASYQNISSLNDDNPFSGCGIRTVNVNDGVEKIPQYFMYNRSSLRYVNIGDTVTSIYGSAFNGCSGLQSITITAQVPPSLYGVNQFANTNDCPVFVPGDRILDYKSAWPSLESRIQAIPTP